MFYLWTLLCFKGALKNDCYREFRALNLFGKLRRKYPCVFCQKGGAPPETLLACRSHACHLARLSRLSMPQPNIHSFLLSPGQTLATFQPNKVQRCWAQHVLHVWPHNCCSRLRHVGWHFEIEIKLLRMLSSATMLLDVAKRI